MVHKLQKNKTKRFCLNRDSKNLWIKQWKDWERMMAFLYRTPLKSLYHRLIMKASHARRAGETMFWPWRLCGWQCGEKTAITQASNERWCLRIDLAFHCQLLSAQSCEVSRGLDGLWQVKVSEHRIGMWIKCCE